MPVHPGFQHISKPKPPKAPPIVKRVYDALANEQPPIEVPDDNADYESERQWKLQDDRDREAQWRYTWADSMLAARGERGRVDDITQVAQTILPALLQAHAMRPGSDEEPLSDDLFGDAQVNGWGSEGFETYYQDDEKAEPQTLAENLAFDAFVLAEAFLDVRRRRYGA